MKNKKTDIGVEFPDLIQKHSAIKAEIALGANQYPPVANPVNKADAAVQAAQASSPAWTKDTPGSLEDFHRGSADYRGQGLLPADQTAGVRVIEK